MGNRRSVRPGMIYTVIWYEEHGAGGILESEEKPSKKEMPNQYGSWRTKARAERRLQLLTEAWLYKHRREE